MSSTMKEHDEDDELRLINWKNVLKSTENGVSGNPTRLSDPHTCQALVLVLVLSFEVSNNSRPMEL